MKLPNLIKKISLVFLSSLLFVNSMAMPFSVAKAQDEPPSTWYNQGFTEWYVKVYGDESPPSEIFGERYTAAQVQWIIWGLISVPLNWFGRDNQEYIACNIKLWGNENIDLTECITGYKGYLEKVIQLISPFTIGGAPETNIASLIRNQSMTYAYLEKQVSKVSVISTAHAQEGFGFGAIGIVQPLWQVSRNLAYAFLVLAVIILAFMIMFRIKISPQVVISVQSALPKIISAAILVTFSYAIAGLVIDLMYVVAGVISGFLSSVPWSPGFATVYKLVTGTGASGEAGGTSPLVIFAYMLVYTVFFLILILASLASVVSTWSIFAALLSILALLLVVWLIILCVWYMIKIPWLLIKTVINIYLSVIVAPVQLMFGSINQQIGFGLWIRNLISNVLVFPFVGVMFYLAFFFLSYGLISVPETMIERSLGGEIARVLGFNVSGFLPGTLWSPPFLGSGAEITPLIFAFMSFGIIVAIPKAADILKAMIMGAKFDYGSAIGEAMSPLKSTYDWGPIRQYRELGSTMFAADLLNKLKDVMPAALGGGAGGKIERLSKEYSKKVRF